MGRKKNHSVKLINLNDDYIAIIDYYLNFDTDLDWAWFTLVNRELMRTPWKLVESDNIEVFKDRIKLSDYDFKYNMRESFEVIYYLLSNAQKSDLNNLPLWFKTEYMIEQLKH